MTLPAKPGNLAEISRVLTSAIAAVGGEQNDLKLTAKRMVCVILVDGLGYHNLERRKGHAPNLASQQGAKSYTVFPSTTAAAITSLATGLSPAEHGIIGHVAFDLSLGVSKNLLSGWIDQDEALAWKSQHDLTEHVSENLDIFNVSASEYRETGFTSLTMSRSVFVAADSMQDRFIAAGELLQDRRNTGVIYLYVQELDQAGHRHGWQSAEWAALLEQLDQYFEAMVERLPADCGIILTADHGQLDSPLESRHELKFALPDSLRAFAGDSRAAYLYLKNENGEDSVIERLVAAAVPAKVYRTETLIAAGWFGAEVSEAARKRLPHLILLANGEHTLFHSDFSKPRSYLMTGHHGGLTEQELAIPLVRVGF